LALAFDTLQEQAMYKLVDFGLSYISIKPVENLFPELIQTIIFPTMSLTMNVQNKYAEWSVDLIKEDVQRNTLPYACLMSHVEGDFNMSTAVRNANAFGCKELFYFGGKRWDKRGSVGTHHYSLVTHLKDMDAIKALKSQYRFVAIECNIERHCVSLFDYKVQPNTLFIFGEESKGLSDEMLNLCDDYVFIPMIGSVRSLNVGTASGILMAEAMKANLRTI
jgi:tRNA G18 (ribose-2'-O)-methylase SpoU